VFQYLAVYIDARFARQRKETIWGVVISCSVLNFFAMCSSMLQCVALCGSAIVHARLVRQHK